MRKQAVRYLVGLAAASAVSLGFIGILSLSAGELVYPFLIWNLFLAWLPLGLAFWLYLTLQHKLWSSWEALLVTVAWLTLLPNSFYMVSDFIHLPELAFGQLLLGVMTISAFVFTSLCLGITSLYLVHREILKRASQQTAALLVGVILLATSIAIYIGRDLRWNSWDVVVNPFGLLFDLSDRLMHPDQYGAALSAILPFFVLLGTMYYVAWQVICLSRATTD